VTRARGAVVLIDADVDTTTVSGRLVVDLIGSVTAFDSRRIGERVRAAHAQMRVQGRRAGQLRILADEFRQRIADEHAAGRSMHAIAGELNAEGVPTAKGARWYASTVAHVLRSVERDRELAQAGQESAAIACATGVCPRESAQIRALRDQDISPGSALPFRQAA